MKLKNILDDIYGALVDLLFMLVRPVLFWLIWNFGVADKTTIPRLDFLQVVSIILIFHIFMSYFPTVTITSSKSEPKTTANE